MISGAPLFSPVQTEATLKMKKWSSQWTQFMQLRKEAWKNIYIQDFNGAWTCDLAISGAMLYQLSYEATDVGSRSIVGCYMLRPFAHPVTCCVLLEVVAQ